LKIPWPFLVANRLEFVDIFGAMDSAMGTRFHIEKLLHFLDPANLGGNFPFNAVF